MWRKILDVVHGGGAFGNFLGALSCDNPSFVPWDCCVPSEQRTFKLETPHKNRATSGFNNMSSRGKHARLKEHGKNVKSSWSHRRFIQILLRVKLRPSELSTFQWHNHGTMVMLSPLPGSGKVPLPNGHEKAYKWVIPILTTYKSWEPIIQVATYSFTHYSIGEMKIAIFCSSLSTSQLDIWTATAGRQTTLSRRHLQPWPPHKWRIYVKL